MNGFRAKWMRAKTRPSTERHDARFFPRCACDPAKSSNPDDGLAGACFKVLPNPIRRL
jgi:hypothetical protein